MAIRRSLGTGLGRREVLKYAGTLAAGAVASPFVSRIDRAFAAWPADRPVKIVVANSPGGPSDLAARFIAPALQEALGGAFIVENRPGGGGNIGIQAVIRAEPDGYTLHLSTSLWAINPSLYDPPPYDPYKDLVPVVEIASSPSAFVAPAALGVKTMKEWVALAKKDQDKFNIATPPIGTTLHLGAELLKQREGLTKVAVAVHSGGGQAIQAVLSNTVQLCSTSLAPAHPHIKSGALTGLMILGEQRWPDLPEVPTAAEAGYENFNFETYTALMAPAKTPPEIVKAIEQAAIKALHKPDMRQKMQNAGFLVQAKTAEEHAARIAREVPMFREIIKSAGVKAK
ncbi:MAG: tripartite tricarboxylate transporter substrate binding protein [Variibacter sp.]|nr:tripartite tricarboxylate transporter substrate binding protein [Variibacter sp.]